MELAPFHAPEKLLLPVHSVTPKASSYRPPRHATRANALRSAALCALCACRPTSCGGQAPRGEVDGRAFVRCAQAEAPDSAEMRTDALTLRVEGRVVIVEPTRPLRVAAFTGPVGEALEKADLELLTRTKPNLIFVVGGLGNDGAAAHENLAALAALHVPTLLVAGGADRASVIGEALSTLAEAERPMLVNASGVREVRIGDDRMIILAGAPEGRYAIADDACGLLDEDFAEIAKHAAERSAKRTWLVSWSAPAGSALTRGFVGSELGSPAVAELARKLSARGGLYAFPEGPSASANAWLLPRLGRSGSMRGDGSRAASQVLLLSLDADGLAALD